MQNALLAGLGGFIGTLLRYLLNSGIYRFFDYPIFPYGVLIINLIGCFVIGLLSGLAETREIFTPEVRIFIFIGILGGFTTFSSFGYDTFNLLRDGQMLFATINVLVQVVGGLFLVWGGYLLSRII